MEFSRERRNLVLAALEIRKKQEKISTDIDMQMHEICVENCHSTYFPIFVRIGLKFLQLSNSKTWPEHIIS